MDTSLSGKSDVFAGSMHIFIDIGVELCSDEPEKKHVEIY